MSNEQAIAKLSAIYGHVEMVRDGVFVAKQGDSFEMFRLTDGVLEHRTDPDYHTVKWEVEG